VTCLLILLLSCACTGPGVTPVIPPKVAPVVVATSLATFPHDPEAFTQGLMFHRGEFYESTGGRGDSTLRRVEIESGRVLQSIDIPERFFAEGLAILGDRAYQLTWQENTGFVYDIATFEQLDTFEYTGEGWGLTTDGVQLIRSDGSNVLRFMDPSSFEVTRSVEVVDGSNPVHNLNELEWVRGEIWANVWNQDHIARIDPESGIVLGWIDLSPLLPNVRFQNVSAVANGIAYDDLTGKIYVTGKLWPSLFEVSVPETAQ